MREQYSLVRKLWGIIYPPAIYYIAQTLVALIVMNVVAAMGTIGGKNISGLSTDEIANMINAVYGVTIVFLAAIITIPLMFLFYKLDMKNYRLYKCIPQYEKVRLPKMIYVIIGAILSNGALNILVTLICYFLPASMLESFYRVDAAITSGNTVMQILSVVIAGPIVEELIFRGLLYKRIKNISNAWASIIITGLMFGIYHMNIVQGIYASIMGFILAYVYEKYKTLWAPIIFHCTANAVSMIVSSIGLFNKTNGATLMTMMFVEMFGLIAMLLIIEKNVVVKEVPQKIDEEEEYRW